MGALLRTLKLISVYRLRLSYSRNCDWKHFSKRSCWVI